MTDLKWKKKGCFGEPVSVRYAHIWVAGDYQIFVYSPTVHQLCVKHAFIENYETLEAAQEKAESLNAKAGKILKPKKLKSAQFKMQLYNSEAVRVEHGHYYIVNHKPNWMFVFKPYHKDCGGDKKPT